MGPETIQFALNMIFVTKHEFYSAMGKILH